MNKLPRPASCARIVLIVLAALAAFHVLLIAGVVPAEVAWGGRLDRSAPGFLLAEALALATLVLFALVVVLRVGWVGGGRPNRAVRIAAWFVFVYFLLNTLGNLAGQTGFERWVFSPLTLMLSLLMFRIARS